jgi:hypothetical protein
MQEVHVIEAGGRGMPRHAGHHDVDMVTLAPPDVSHHEAPACSMDQGWALR